MRKLYINNQIRAKEVRVVDSNGKQLGIFRLEKAIELAKEKGLDLIKVTEKVEPPVCKIADYGKYLYQQKKKEKAPRHFSETKGIRLTFGISEHDLEIKAHQAKKFLEKGDKIRVEMKLKGREKALEQFAKEKVNKFLEILNNLIELKIERELKKEPRGLTMIITKK